MKKSLSVHILVRLVLSCPKKVIEPEKVNRQSCFKVDKNYTPMPATTITRYSYHHRHKNHYFHSRLHNNRQIWCWVRQSKATYNFQLSLTNGYLINPMKMRFVYRAKPNLKL